MSLTGAIKPTFLYPRITYGSPAVTLDVVEPTTRIPTLTPYTGLRGANTVASGKREYLFGRGEEQVGLVVRCEQDQLAALRWFVQDFAAEGHQFQTWVDRHTGSCWMFENTLKDQNGLALTHNGGSAVYASASTGTGIVLSGSKYLTVPVAQASAVTPTGYDDPILAAEGVIVVDFTPTFNGNDSTQHNIVDSAPDPPRLILYKTAANVLMLQINDGVAGKSMSGSVTWISGDRVQIVGSWTTTGTIALWYAVNSGSFVALTTSAGAGSGILPGTPTTLSIGATTAGATPALGTYDTVAFYKRAFDEPQRSLANFRPIERNYFPYGELIAATFQPVRVTLGRPIWDWAMTVRNGVA
jgi:hypothetical protein